MKKKWLILLASLGVILAASSVGVTTASFFDQEISSGNTFEAWTSILWGQTTQSDFEAGVLNNVDTSSSAGNVTLAVKSGWYNGSWAYRKKLTFNNSGQAEDLTDFTVLVALDSSNFDFNKAEYNGEDVRFVDSDNTTLKYEIERWDKGGQRAWIWVRVPQIDASSSTDYIWMYYGNPGASDGQDVTNTWRPKWKTVCHMAQASGSEKDSITNSFDYVQKGTVNSMDGKIGRARSVSSGGDANYFDRGNPDSLKNVRPHTIMAWINPSSFPVTYSRPISKEPAGGAGLDWETGTENGQKLRQWVGASQDSNSAMTAGTWYFWATTFNAVSAKIYLNGSLDKDGTLSDTDDSGANLLLFRSGKGTGRYFYGEIDEFRIYSGELSAAWLKAEYLSMTTAFVTYGAETSKYVSSGTIASQVLDTEVDGARWDALFWDETVEAGTTDIIFEVRASDTWFDKGDATPDWTDLGTTNSPITSGLPWGRYKQWRATLTTSDTSKTSVLHEVRLYYY